MESVYVEGEKFEQNNFTEKLLAAGEYEHCSFLNCNFSNTNLNNFLFSACVFDGCNLGMAQLNGTAFRQIQFNNCKLLGLHFEQCNQFLFEVAFDNCILNLSSFYKQKLKKTKFSNTGLHEADFTETDLTSAVFENCDLAGAIFEQAILEKTDFRTAFNYSINPERNRIKKARFSFPGVTGLLHHYDIEIV
jgi:fluoroquinolone resistance protein